MARMYYTRWEHNRLQGKASPRLERVELSMYPSRLALALDHAAAVVGGLLTGVMLGLTVLLVLVCSGCHQPDTDPALDPSLAYLYAPSPEIHEPVRRALATLRHASGLPFAIDLERGTPISPEPPESVVSNDGERVCGFTQLLMRPAAGEVLSVDISIASPAPERCNDAEHVALHEVIHSALRYQAVEHYSQLQASAGPDMLNALHADSGVFAEDSGDTSLNEASLTVLCTYLPCTEFNPEP